MINKLPQTNVYILPEAKARLDLYVELAEGEISGLGIVKKYGRYDFLIEEIFLFDQDCTPDSTVLSPEAVADFLVDMITKEEDPSSLRLWWHSHSDLGVFWSTDDEDTMRGFRNDWMISLVCNRSREYLARLDVYQPIHLSLSGLPLHILLPVTDIMKRKTLEEITRKVKFTIPPPTIPATTILPVLAEKKGGSV